MQKVSLITGGGKGIGSAVAKKLALRGPVYIVGRDEAALADTCSVIRAAGAEVEYLVGDISDPQVANVAASKLFKRGWFVRNLILNAGVGYGGPTESYEKSKFIETFAINVFGAFYFAQKFLPAMLERREGYVLFMSSILGLVGAKRQAAYSASKAAQVSLARSLAKEYGKHGVVVIPICPDFVHSDMTERTVNGLIRHRSFTREQALTVICKASSVGRILTQEEVAEAVEEICSGVCDSHNGSPYIWTKEGRGFSE